MASFGDERVCIESGGAVPGVHILPSAHRGRQPVWFAEAVSLGTVCSIFPLLYRAYTHVNTARHPIAWLTFAPCLIGLAVHVVD
jgi:hypothetical protein